MADKTAGSRHEHSLHSSTPSSIVAHGMVLSKGSGLKHGAWTKPAAHNSSSHPTRGTRAPIYRREVLGAVNPVGRHGTTRAETAPPPRSREDCQRSRWPIHLAT